MVDFPIPPFCVANATNLVLLISLTFKLLITRFYDFLPIQRYEHFDVHVYRSLLHYGDLELLQCFIISIRQYDSESVSLYVSGASWMQRDAAIVTGLFVAANACFIIFSNHWFNVSAAK